MIHIILYKELDEQNAPVGNWKIINFDSEEDTNAFLALYTNAPNYVYELPQEDVLRIFGDSANLASNENTQISGDKETGFTLSFVKPLPNLRLLRDQKKKEAENALTAKIAEITPYYPTDEKVSFAKQEEEAKLYTANPQIELEKIPCIAGIAKGRQMELSVLVEKIMAKVALFSSVSGVYMGRKQRIEDLADKAKTAEEIQAINVAEIFSEPMA